MNSSSQSRELEKWRVWARITGPALPDAQVRIGAALVGPVAGSYRPPEPSLPPIDWPADTTYFVARGAELRVVSTSWVIFTDVVAERDDAAIERVARDEVPLLLAALSAGYAEFPYRIQMVGADNGVEGFGYSTVASSAFFEAAILSSERAAEAHTRITAIRANPDLVIASDLLARGLEYMDLLAGRLTFAAAVLAFYQVLEACARIVPWDAPANFDDERAKLLSEVATTLSSKKSAQKRATALREGARKLDRLEAKYTSLRIEHAATAFGLNKDWLNRARSLGQFRNRHLGHASALPSWEELEHWTKVDGESVSSAFAVASTMIAGAFRYVQAKP